MNIASILYYLGKSVSREKRQYVYSGALDLNTKAQYDALVWLDSRPKPAWATIVLSDTVATAWHTKHPYGI